MFAKGKMSSFKIRGFQRRKNSIFFWLSAKAYIVWFENSLQTCCSKEIPTRLNEKITSLIYKWGNHHNVFQYYNTFILNFDTYHVSLSCFLSMVYSGYLLSSFVYCNKPISIWSSFSLNKFLFFTLICWPIKRNANSHCKPIALLHISTFSFNRTPCKTI